MKIYPAIDIMGGKAVRLVRGNRKDSKVYGDPLDFASKFSGYFDRLHIIDLDGSFSGKPKNLDIISRIKAETGIWIQIGGGFREMDSIERGLAAGADSIILGTAAMDRSFMDEVYKRKYKVTVSLDTSGSGLVSEGWAKAEGTSAQELFSRHRERFRRFILTDTDRDGTLSGPSRVEKFWDGEEMIYAGGVSGVGDLKNLSEAGFTGVVVGKALYEGRFDFSDTWGVEA